MTIAEAINRIDSLKHNTYSHEDKVLWLSRLDKTVKEQIINTHAGGEAVAFTGYDASTPVSTQLLVPSPFDEVYLRYMEAQMDYHNGEYGKYNNAILMYNTAFQAYADHYNRQHMPIARGRRFLF